eukprot:scaffold5020_cov119-Skeletonema_dohrnii-CCMP3373.AAC.1
MLRSQNGRAACLLGGVDRLLDCAVKNKKFVFLLPTPAILFPALSPAASSFMYSSSKQGRGQACIWGEEARSRQTKLVV